MLVLLLGRMRVIRTHEKKGFAESVQVYYNICWLRGMLVRCEVMV